MSKPLIIAHRGASVCAPENTLRAFSMALEQGADGIELDVRLSRDKDVLVIHDEWTGRVADRNLKVSDACSLELQGLELDDGEHVPSLLQVLKRFGSQFNVINIEIKSSGWIANGIETCVAKIIRATGMEERVLVSSFDPLCLWRFKRLLPGVRTGYLVSGQQQLFLRNDWILRWLKPDTLNLEQAVLEQKKFAKMVCHSQPKWLWTVDDEGDMRACLDRDDVEAVITNFPDRLVRVLRS